MIRKIVKSLDAKPAEQAFRIIAVVSLLATTFVGVDTRIKTECQAQYNEANNARTATLTQASEDERQAERKADDALTALIQGVQPPVHITFAEYQQLIADLNTALIEQQKERRDADEARATHPVLAAPSTRCRGFDLF